MLEWKTDLERGGLTINVKKTKGVVSCTEQDGIKILDRRGRKSSKYR